MQDNVKPEFFEFLYSFDQEYWQNTKTQANLLVFFEAEGSLFILLDKFNRKREKAARKKMKIELVFQLKK